MAYRFLTKAEILRIHQEMVSRHGGEPHIWDSGRLDASIHAPKAGFGGILAHNSISEIAGAYWFHLSQNHPFAAANKRTAMASCLTFLRLNGFRIDCNHEELVGIGVRVAEGKMTEAELATWLEQHLVRTE